MPSRYEEVMSLSLRRGFLYPAAEVYGGVAGFYDYGHLGAALKRNLEDLWLRHFLGLDDNYHLIDTTSVLPFRSLQASGHVDHFTDVMLTCAKCNRSVKAEGILENAGVRGAGLPPEGVDEAVEANGLKCEDCGGAFRSATAFNMMFPIAIGPEGKDRGFLRPETAQGAYLAFKREHESLRRVLPMGLAIIGRAFRNEISPRLGAFRLREFIQAELQIFFNPARFDRQLPSDALDDGELRVLAASEPSEGEAVTLTPSELVQDHRVPRFFAHHMALVGDFYERELGVPHDRLRLHEVGEGERAHYNRIQYDVEVDMASLGGYREVAGIHYRGDYDLSGHQAGSNRRMAVMDGDERVVPHVLELSFGLDRTLWALLDLHYELEREDRAVLHLPASLSPVQVGVFPHIRKDGMPKKAAEVHETLRGPLKTFYDDSGSVGRRYARMDEVGTPYCVTVDHLSMEGEGVTIRDRDTKAQVRVPEDRLLPVLEGLLAGRGLPEDLSFTIRREV